MTPRINKTIIDIAKEAGVSVATASRALSSAPNTHSSKQMRVIEVAQKYNYKPSIVARGLNKGKMRMLGVVLPEITHPFYCEIFNAAEMEARAHGYSVVFHRLTDGEQGYQSFLDQLIEQRLDGMLLAGGLVENTKGPSRIELLETIRQYMPIVIVGRPVEGFSCVCLSVDMAESTRVAVRHLHALGHERFAFLGGNPLNITTGDREEGFYDEIRRLGLDQRALLHEGGYSPADGEAGVMRLLGTREREEWPTAILAINDLVALGAMRQLTRMGIRIPEDIAVVGCDNQFFSAYTSPPLTTLDLHTSSNAQLAVRYLLNPPDVDGRSVVHRVDADLIVRESCGARLGRRSVFGIQPAPSGADGILKGETLKRDS